MKEVKTTLGHEEVLGGVWCVELDCICEVFIIVGVFLPLQMDWWG